jgi:DNA-binding CsgD family transcriptional regulator
MAHRLKRAKGTSPSRNNGGAGAGARQGRPLSPAEWRAVHELARGLGPAEIADSFGLSVHTVRTQLKRAMEKAGVHTQAALVAWVFSRER